MSDAWSATKCIAFKAAFQDFLGHVYINSKDSDEPLCLAEHIYDAQQRLLDEIMDGLQEGIRHFYVLKSRQLGVSTFARALTLFWLGYHKGLKGAMIFDSEGNRNNARTELEEMCANLPAPLGFPGLTGSNRDMLLFANQAKISLLAAGKKQTTNNKGMGASLAISFMHASEMAAWGNAEGVEAFRQCFSEVHPNRLYIWESTARGYEGVWNDLWEEAKKDKGHSKCIFLGWYLKPSQQISRKDKEFKLFGVTPPSDAEEDMIAEVKKRYNWQITPEQLAWYRRKMDPSGGDEEGDKEYTDNTFRLQEQPSTEDEAWQMTGAKFFDPEALTEQAHKNANNKYDAYAFGTGMEFFDMTARKATTARERQLKVWHEPQPDAVYILCADVAFGANENNDRSAVSVLRCYSDGVDQVAEYAWPLITTRPFAWVIAALAGWYSALPNSSVYLIIEINGPGEAVWNELQSLKNQMATRYKFREFEEKGLINIFRNVYNYLYTRSDSMSPGSVYQWKTTGQVKVAIMERLRDFVTNGMLIVRSMETLEEMKRISREGDSICAQGASKDDRVLALAMGVRMWDERVRKRLLAENRTRAAESAKSRRSFVDQVGMFNESMLTQFFAQKKRGRINAKVSEAREQWRSR